MNIDIYADGADLQSIKELNELSCIAGFTTNPALMRKAGVENYMEFASNAVKIVKEKPISFEVIADDFPTMKLQALKLRDLGSNVYVKIPVTNTLGLPSYGLISKLVNDGVKLNITAILTKAQVVRTIDALGERDSIISIFAGRISDAGIDPSLHFRLAKDLKEHGQKILWASTRELYNIVQAEDLGVDIITVPHSMLNKLSLLGKDLDEYSLETVKMFYNDAVSSGYEI